MSGTRPVTGAESSVALTPRPTVDRIRGHLHSAGLTPAHTHTHTHTRTHTHTHTHTPL